MNPRFVSIARCFGVLASMLAFGCSGAANRETATAAAEPVKVCAGQVVTNDAELAGLAGCGEVRGDLSVRNVSSLAPLAGLRQVQGRVAIYDNPELENLDGLNDLRSVHALVLHHNGIYTTEGLEALRSVGSLKITHNPRLISIAGLNYVRFAGEITLEHNPRLCAYYGLLRGLEGKPSRVVVRDNRGLSPDETATLMQAGIGNIAAR